MKRFVVIAVLALFLHQHQSEAVAQSFSADFNGDNRSDLCYFDQGYWKMLFLEFGQKTSVLGNGSMKPVPADYDGDGKDDIAIYEPAPGIWHISCSTEGYRGVQFGNSTMKPAPADYDGDGRDDLCVYEPGPGIWHISCSTEGYKGVQFGNSTMKPVPADFDGDGRDDLCLYEPGPGIWHISCSTEGYKGYQFGNNTMTPLPADYDGDGRADLCLYEHGTGTWHISCSTEGYKGYQFGNSTTTPVPGDYDGDGRTDLCIFENNKEGWSILYATGETKVVALKWDFVIPAPADFDGDGKDDKCIYEPLFGKWHITYSGGSFAAFQFGNSTMKPVPADFDGDGRADLCVYEPGPGIWHISCSTEGYKGYQFGNSTMIPLPADYDGDGRDDLCLYEPGPGIWHISCSTEGYRCVQFGNSDMKPLPADYDGDGKTDLCLYNPDPGLWHILCSTEGYKEFQFGNNTMVPFSGDYDGDGRADRCLFHLSELTTHVMYSHSNEGRDFTWWADSWNGGIPIGNSDFNGDGIDDLTLYHEFIGSWKTFEKATYEPEKLNIMTYDLQSQTQNMDMMEYVSQLADYIISTDSDVIGFQNIPFEDKSSFRLYLLNNLQAKSFSALAMPCFNESQSLLFLSKYPLLDYNVNAYDDQIIQTAKIETAIDEFVSLVNNNSFNQCVDYDQVIDQYYSDNFLWFGKFENIKDLKNNVSLLFWIMRDIFLNPDYDGDGVPEDDYGIILLEYPGDTFTENIIFSTQSWVPSYVIADNSSSMPGEVPIVATFLRDSDCDGMPDEWETLHGFDPMTASNGDSDGDGLSDLQEYRNGTNPKQTDTDSDGLTDLAEVTYGFNPLVAGEASMDEDGDGFTNSQEIDYKTNPLKADSDGDGLNDYQEIITYQTDPVNPFFPVEVDEIAYPRGIADERSFYRSVSNGSSYILVYDNDGLYYRTVNSLGQFYGSEVLISNTSAWSKECFVCAWDGNNYLVVWADNIDDDEVNIYGQFIASNGSILGSVFLIDSFDGQIKGLNMTAANNTFFVAYAIPDDSLIHVSSVSFSGQPAVNNDIYISPITNDEYFYPDIDFDGEKLLVTWFHDQMLKGQFINYQGTPVNSLFDISYGMAHKVLFNGEDYIVCIHGDPRYDDVSIEPWNPYSKELAYYMIYLDKNGVIKYRKKSFPAAWTYSREEGVNITRLSEDLGLMETTSKYVYNSYMGFLVVILEPTGEYVVLWVLGDGNYSSIMDVNQSIIRKNYVYSTTNPSVIPHTDYIEATSNSLDLLFFSSDIDNRQEMHLSTTYYLDSESDVDGDGRNTREEIIAGTDPLLAD